MKVETFNHLIFGLLRFAVICQLINLVFNIFNFSLLKLAVVSMGLAVILTLLSVSGVIKID